MTRLQRMYALGVMSFVLFLSTLAGVPVLPKLSTELGADLSMIPVIVSASLIAVVLIQPFTGVLADRFPRKWVVFAGALAGSLTSLACVFATSWRQLLFLRAAGGAADAISMPAILAITASLAEGQQGRFLGILRSSQGLSFVIGPALGGAFSLIWLRAPFLADGILSLVACLAAAILIEPENRVVRKNAPSPLSGLRMTFADRRVYLLLLIGVSGLFGFGMLYGLVSTKAQVLGLASWRVGAILGGGALVFSAVSLFVGRIADKARPLPLVIASELVIVLAAAGLSLAGGFAALCAFYSLFCVGEATVCLLSFAYAARLFRQEHMGASMGAFDSVMDLSLFVGPVVAAVSLKALGTVNAVIPIVCIPAALALAAALFRLRQATAGVGSTVPAPLDVEETV